MGKKASKVAAAAGFVSGAEADALQAEWDKRDKVSAAQLVGTWNHVAGALGHRLEKVLPEVAPLWKKLQAISRENAVVKEAVDFFTPVPEPVRYVLLSALSALLMESRNIAKALEEMTPEARTIAAGEIAQVLFSMMSEFEGRTRGPRAVAEEVQMRDGNPPAGSMLPQAFATSTFDTPGAQLGLVEYTVMKGPSAGQKRPAVVTRLEVKEEGVVADLTVFFSPADMPHESWGELQNVPFSPRGTKGAWFHPGVAGWVFDPSATVGPSPEGDTSGSLPPGTDSLA